MNFKSPVFAYRVSALIVFILAWIGCSFYLELPIFYVPLIPLFSPQFLIVVIPFLFYVWCLFTLPAERISLFTKISLYTIWGAFLVAGGTYLLDYFSKLGRPDLGGTYLFITYPIIAGLPLASFISIAIGRFLKKRS